jgi:hypothetical protein
MLQLMEADVVFISEHRPLRPAGDPRDHPGIAALVKHGFDVEVLDDSIEYWGDEWFEEWTERSSWMEAFSTGWVTSSNPSAAIR